MKKRTRNLLIASFISLGINTITLSSLTSCNNNEQNEVQKNKGTIKIESLPTLLEYKAGEALNLEGLSVKFYEEGSKEGVEFSDFTTNPSNGYVFKNEDVSDEFKVVVLPNDSNLRSVSFEIKVAPGKVEEIATTPFQFLSSLKDAPSYTISNDKFSGKFIPNGSYWTFKDGVTQNYGFAQNDTEIIRYTIVNGNVARLNTYSIDETTTLYSDDFFEISNELGYPNNCLQRITDEDFEHYKTLKRRRNTNIYSVKLDTDPSSVKTYVRNLIQLTTPNQVILSDNNLNIALGYNVTFDLEMISDNEMVFSIKGADGTSQYPIKTTIKKEPELKIDELHNFFNGIVDPNEKPATEATKNALLNNNFTVTEGDKVNAIFNKNYAYFGDVDEKNILSLTKETSINGTSYQAGLYKYSIKDGQVFIGEMFENGASEVAPFLNQMSLFKEFSSYFFYFGENAFIFTAMLNETMAPYGSDAPDLYTLFKNLPLNDRPVSIDNVEFSVRFKDSDFSAILDMDCSIKINEATPSSKFKLTNFGTSKVDSLENFYQSIN